MSKEREQQMMAAADAYAAGCYADEPVSFSTEENICETIADFCAGWRACDNSRWIPVEERLPEIPKNDWKSDNVLFVVNGEIFYGYRGKYTWYAPFLSFNNHEVTHWMPRPVQPRKEDNK